ncbi:abortive infection family protein [Pseudomonas amygdali]|uniref:abortive infection family protein n=1 Tax=Pseudomonas amygdali TaxID=47877 RepID=UPI000AEB4C27|nr:abortive infection family protein [Pseudomonas amygdali]
MTSRKEALKRMSQRVLETRSEVRAGLENVEKELRDAVSGLSIYVTGMKVVLGMVDEDDWEYAKLNFDGENLRILTSTTHEDGHNYGTYREGEMHVRSIAYFNDEKLTKIASKDSINSLWTAVEEAISDMLGEAKSSVRLLSEFSDVQSESIHKDLADLMKGDYFEQHWANARLAIDTDASDSLTRTTQFLESVCRHYLEKREISLGKIKTVSEFINAVADDFPPLVLPESSENSEEIKAQFVKDVKALLGGIKSVSQGCGIFRTHYGTAHGGNKTAYADEARLVNNLAGAVSIYILEKLKSHMVAKNHE